MRVLHHNFLLFQWVGLWRPVHWLSGWKSTLYDSYTVFILFLVSSITLSEFIELVRSTDDVEAFTNNAFILMTMVGVCGKATNILKKRKELIRLTNVLLNDPCRPRTVEELAIQKKYDEINRLNLYFLSGNFPSICICFHIYYDHDFLFWDLLKVEYFALCLADRSCSNSGSCQFSFKRRFQTNFTVQGMVTVRSFDDLQLLDSLSSSDISSRYWSQHQRCF